MEAISGLSGEQILGNDLLAYVRDMVLMQVKYFSISSIKSRALESHYTMIFCHLLILKRTIISKWCTLSTLDSAGKYDGMVGTVEDITERKKGRSSVACS